MVASRPLHNLALRKFLGADRALGRQLPAVLGPRRARVEGHARDLVGEARPRRHGRAGAAVQVATPPKPDEEGHGAARQEDHRHARAEVEDQVDLREEVKFWGGLVAMLELNIMRSPMVVPTGCPMESRCLRSSWRKGAAWVAYKAPRTTLRIGTHRTSSTQGRNGSSQARPVDRKNTAQPQAKITKAPQA
eukprot:CAMPEP_0170286050 /NCGR_PEP_ID=MMETSP0116_2-20130129/43079_1 /TAXON_ID=400756 /ORGANISM="Durinskia baltica, Strain CSIRO CS-38" /LENGTH=190 /DNA_ID=CAMNT_0010537461 /DNA_START=84 /DNA_END=657 /DNA_ORIENTATION=-